jgi:class 3 adenylate cyclase
MSDAEPKSVEDQLSLSRKQVDLMLAIDEACDTAADDIEAMTAAVSLIVQALEAEVGLLSWFDPDTQRLEVRSLIDRVNALTPSGQAALQQLSQAACDLPAVQLLPAAESLGALSRLHWVGAPLRVKERTLGALLLANLERPFTEDELSILDVGVAELDSALLHLHTVHELRFERQELRVLYTIDRIRDRGLPFNDMLDAVLLELCGAVPAEAGFIMLYDIAGHQLELRAATNHDLLRMADQAQLVQAAADEAVHRGAPALRALAAGPIRSLICLPLILNERIIGVLGVINRVGRADFTRIDQRLLAAIASQIDTAIFEGLQIQRLREAFGRRVGAKVMDRMLAMPEHDWLKGERVTVTALFSDIRGFTATSEEIAPELLVQILSDHLSAMTEVVRAHDGTLDKFIGDGVMSLYNVPLPQPDHALRAIQTACEMMTAHRAVMQRWPQLPPIGIGLDTGEVIVGNFGSTQRLEYTAIGHHINLAARLCGAAEGDQVLISAATYALVREHVLAEAVPALRLKGITEAVSAYQVLGLK